METPFNSVCMATFNGERFIEAQITSILSQIAPNDELIIADDGSTDQTIAVIKSIKDSRIKLFKGNNFKDPIKNFQFALKQTSGVNIFLSDQDDVWLDNKYALMLKQLENYDLVISDSQIVNEALEPLYPSFFDYFNSGKGVIKNMMKSSYYGSCMAFRRSVLISALPFPDTKEIGHDLWIGLVAELTGKVCFYKKQLILYRRHEHAFTPVNVGKSKRTKMQMLRGRIIMIKEVAKFIIFKNLWKKD
ncbi:glycosyltransferase family 2 protein [Pedobacter mucosus]|uniref:glycosyltransferase family 2 protein n=1 Tax=Pedobacter mucosus TaxID=2895286 RepID=UPI001EE3CE86|nr:glycosyltransferase family 2 protein [Pedobacter mucosus]UKT63273.1 glycosyltransferase family 2 protein [Pedobacter mucosus]